LAVERLSGLAEIVDPSLSQYDSRLAFRKQEKPAQALERLRHGLYVVRRNKNLIRNCDLLLANLLDADKRASIGSIGEICWANAFEKPIIIVRERSSNVHDHAMLNAVASSICHSLDDAFAAIAQLARVDARPHSQSDDIMTQVLRRAR
jgi:nucleoside 2-deoxyribosyltransferase